MLMIEMPHWPKNIRRNYSDQSHSTTKTILKYLGNPHHNLPPTIHVAGTNGKGSTIKFLQHILQAAGYKVHCYTSPHIHSFNERIQIAGHDIYEDQLYPILEECRIICEQHDAQVTFFEGTSIAAFKAFASYDADFLLMETGMGGRLDTTNIVEDKLATIITPISYGPYRIFGQYIRTDRKRKSRHPKKIRALCSINAI